ncbi:MAG: DUF4292 domain-containing protein [Geopsychrobacter sp.]|nr:DUF4292 domain-containing protein [Geopsychrobacter sp.]
MKHLATLLLLLLIVGCARPQISLPPKPEAQLLLQRLATEGARWQQLDAAAKIGFVRAGKHMSTQQFLLLARPDRLRVDVLALFNQLALQLSVVEGELQILLKTTNPVQFYHGPASDELLARFTRLPLRAEQLINLILYAPPVSAGASARVEIVAERYLLTLNPGDGGYRQQFFFDERLRLRRAVYQRNANILLSVDYSKIAGKDNFPRRIQIKMPVQQTAVTITLSDVILNEPSALSRFQIAPPVNAVPLKLPGFNIGGGER